MISEYVAREHRTCDEIFASAEKAAEEADWPRLASRFADFDAAMLRHFSQEDDILFPAFEERTGMAGGPTYIMREEHVQMRETLEDMRGAVAAKNAELYLGLSETLLMLMQQHNVKEEQILYPMMDRVFQGEENELIAQLAA